MARQTARSIVIIGSRIRPAFACRKAGKAVGFPVPDRSSSTRVPACPFATAPPRSAQSGTPCVIAGPVSDAASPARPDAATIVPPTIPCRSRATAARESRGRKRTRYKTARARPATCRPDDKLAGAEHRQPPDNPSATPSAGVAQNANILYSGQLRPAARLRGEGKIEEKSRSPKGLSMGGVSAIIEVPVRPLPDTLPPDGTRRREPLPKRGWFSPTVFSSGVGSVGMARNKDKQPKGKYWREANRPSRASCLDTTRWPAKREPPGYHRKKAVQNRALPSRGGFGESAPARRGLGFPEGW